MQIFSLVSLLIVAGLIMMIFLSKEPEEYVVERESYNQAIDQAESAVGKLEYVPSLSSKAVFIYDGISVPNDVLVVDLSNQGLSGSLKAEIRQLSNLKELNLSNNQFTGLPAEVGQLSQLEKLNLANNPLSGLPHELGNLQKLKLLDLRGVKYSAYDLEVIKTSLPATTEIKI